MRCRHIGWSFLSSDQGSLVRVRELVMPLGGFRWSDMELWYGWKQLVSRRSTRTSSIWLDILRTGVEAWQISKRSSQIIIEISSLQYVWSTERLTSYFPRI